MKRIYSITMIALLFTVCLSIVAQAADVDWRSARKTLVGTVSDVDNRRQELTIRSEDYARCLVRADEAKITSGGREIRFSDIREGDRLKVYGDLRSDGVMDAYTIDVLDRDDRHDRWDWGGNWEIGKIVTVSGEVEDVDYGRNRIDLSSKVGRISVVIARFTDIREMGRRKQVRDIREGDRLLVTGKVETRNTMTANTININGEDTRGGGNLQTVLMGEVVRDTGVWDRDIKVRTHMGEVIVDVPKGAKVTKRGMYISIHEIRRGENIRALGVWHGNTFTANQIDVTSSRDDDDRNFGKIDRIDYDDREFYLKIERRSYLVVARGADITDGGRRISFRDLKNGQEVSVYGERRGDTIYAERIDRGSYYYRDGKDYKPVLH